ncbi:MAG TPA: hypothetical protein VFT22_03295 [Kofleriaceae bacterium]|nr:hypothetical protein [Kofleriaceae bacterium]
MTDATDMTTPVTRGELRAELEQLEARFDHKLEQLEIRLEEKLEKKLEEKLAHLATKADLEIWGGALLDRLLTELARHTRAVEESLAAQIRVLDDKYNDLPGRVNRLEATVFGPPRR